MLYQICFVIFEEIKIIIDILGERKSTSILILRNIA
jgi:hypothetical protein